MRIRGITYWRDERGMVAVEFGLLAAPFFMLLMGLIEVSLSFAAGVVLEGASADAARLIRTGQAQTSADPEAMFRERLCDKVGIMLDCDSIQYEVIRVEPNSFSGAQSYTPVFDDEGNLVSSGFSTGNSNDVVLIRTVYKYEFLTPYLGAMMTGSSGKNWVTHMATVVVKAEPYIFGED